MKKFNYENKTYLEKLGELDHEFYKKYISNIEKLSKNKTIKILEVGCGIGTVLKELKKNGFKNLYGVDISSLFINKAKKDGLKKVYKYDGINLPFSDNTFDLICSFNVLEHTEEPEEFLKEEIKKLKRKGYIIVACPNFYTPVLKTNHRRIHGFRNRILNIGRILIKSIIKNGKFERIPPVIKENFEYDDDSIVVTNPLDLNKFIKNNNCEVILESGFINKDDKLTKLIDKFALFRYAMPSCFVVARKK